MKIAFIINPTAGRNKGEKIYKELEDILTKYSYQTNLFRTQKPLHATELASSLKEECDVIVAVGGDGTIHEVANGIIGSNCKLGIIPVGTGNDFVKILNIPFNLIDALNLILNARTRMIDVGNVNGKYFINGLGIGFDAWVVKKSFSVKKLRGNLVYLYSVLTTLFSYKSTHLIIEMNDLQFDNEYFMLTVGNGPALGGGFRLTPNARIDDQLFDLCLINTMSINQILINLLKVYSGNHIHHPRVETYQTKKLLVKSDIPFAAHVDGEILGFEITNLDISIVPNALEVIC